MKKHKNDGVLIITLTKLEIWKVLWYETSHNNKFHLEFFKPFHDLWQSKIIGYSEYQGLHQLYLRADSVNSYMQQGPHTDVLILHEDTLLVSHAIFIYSVTVYAFLV